MADLKLISDRILDAVSQWEKILAGLSGDILTDARNDQERSIIQILGHLIDSCSNNTHRIIHLQYDVSPVVFPNYATHGNNDRWIAIENYQNEDWQNLVQLWKYANTHLAHVILNIDVNKMESQWCAGDGQYITLGEMVTDYPEHMLWHLTEIQNMSLTKASLDFKVRATVILIENNEILLTKQRVTPSRNWSLPGGTLEAGETLEDCVAREMKEETGLDVAVARMLYVCERFQEGKHVLAVLFEVKRLNGTLKLGHEPEAWANPIQDVKMVPIGSLQDYGFTERFQRLVEMGFPNSGTYQGLISNIGL